MAELRNELLATLVPKKTTKSSALTQIILSGYCCLLLIQMNSTVNLIRKLLAANHDSICWVYTLTYYQACSLELQLCNLFHAY